MTVFVSYNSQDSDVIPREFKRQLDEKLGDCTFLDRSSIRPGMRWKQSILSGLARAQVLVLVAGPRFFEDDQMDRLAENSSVIRLELETARRSRRCKIIPAYFDCKPPHRNGMIWPKDMSWLGELQWIELRKDRVALDVAEITLCICREIAEDTIVNLRAESGPFNLISAVDSSSPEVVHAIVDSLRGHSASETALRRKLLILNDAKFGAREYEVPAAIHASGLFSDIDAWLRAVYVLRNSATTTSRREFVGLNTLDHDLRRQSVNSMEQLTASRAPSTDQLLNLYLSVVLRRLRERLEQVNLDSPKLLSDFFSYIRKLDRSSRDPLNGAIGTLNRWGIAVDQRDDGPFAGRGRLGDAVRIIQRSGRSLQGKHRRSGRAARRSHPR